MKDFLSKTVVVGPDDDPDRVARAWRADAFDGPAVVVDLVVGQEPESGVEFDVLVSRKLPKLATTRKRMVRLDVFVEEE